jgi:PmbA protein
MQAQTRDPIFQRLDEVKQAVSEALDYAKELGASSAEAAMSSTSGLSVSTRLGEVETIEYNQDGALGISVYVGNKKGSASTADLSKEALKTVVSKAVEIAKYTSDDPFNGIADKSLLDFTPQNLDLYHPWQVSAEHGIELCQQVEHAATEHDARITNSDGASFSSHNGLRVYGNSYGQLIGFPRSRHSLSCMVIAEENGLMQRDSAYTISRQQAGLASSQSIGIEAATETLARLNCRRIPTGRYPVVFRADIASSLFGHLISAIGGGALYRKSSFLLDSLGQQIFSSKVNIQERPHMLAGLASSAVDSEGVRTQDRDIVTGGELQTYLLASYAARKLGMQATGHAGGIHNWLVAASHQGLTDILNEMGTGFLVTEVMGQGVNIVNGDYSRGAAGFWVENGKIQFPVSEVTIAGNLKEMFLNIAGIGGDVDKRGSIQTGSVFIENMAIAGE